MKLKKIIPQAIIQVHIIIHLFQVSIVERGLKTVSDSLDSDLKLKGVMRVGPLAKGLLLRSDAQVQLVLLASEVKNIFIKRLF